MRFEDVIATEAELRQIYPPATGAAAEKVIDRIDPVCRRYIAASPFVLIATMGADGLLDISPKGDPAGFVRVLDEHTLAVPDRPGNNRMDTFGNILANPAVGLIFLIPGHRDTLRVSGRARLVRDAWLLDGMAVNGRAPTLALVIDVQEVFTHCPKCAIRSGLWEPERWPDLAGVPSLAEALLAHSALPGDAAALQERIDLSSRDSLY